MYMEVHDQKAKADVDAALRQMNYIRFTQMGLQAQQVKEVSAPHQLTPFNNGKPEVVNSNCASLSPSYHLPLTRATTRTLRQQVICACPQSVLHL